ncbi:hypothetical protein, partial [Variovorax sp. 67-131]
FITSRRIVFSEAFDYAPVFNSASTSKEVFLSTNFAVIPEEIMLRCQPSHRVYANFRRSQDISQESQQKDAFKTRPYIETHPPSKARLRLLR